MASPSRSSPTKQPNRPHFIRQWADKHSWTQADLSRVTGADKSVISRWYKGSSPSEPWQVRLATLFQCDREDLFQHPDESWFKEFLKGRTQDEIDHIKRSLEAIFPRKTKT